MVRSLKQTGADRHGLLQTKQSGITINRSHGAFGLIWRNPEIEAKK